jgi:3D (Asp-Asp-Asp) domain-containing protein
MVDYGDRVEFYKAQDCGGAIVGNHIDLAVATHDEAVGKGRLTATVYFVEVQRSFE